jgi:DNA repair exonuclease SbcCD ATPase subunit
MNDVKINLENIGGITTQKSFTLRSGVNFIKAPNAVGKSSLVRGLQTLILPESILKNHTEFLNDFSTSTTPGRVKIHYDGKELERKIRRSGDTLDVIGKPFYSDGQKANLLSVAIPENEFLDLTIKGKPITRFFDEFSEIKYYYELIKWTDDRVYDILRELQDKREDITQLKALRIVAEKNRKRLKELETEKDKLKPLYDKIRKERWDKKLEELGGLREKKRDLHVKIAETKELKQRAEREIPILTREINKLQKEIDDFQKRYPDVDRQIDELYDKIQRLKKAREEIDDKEALVEWQLKAANLDLQGVSVTEYDKLRKCLECGRPWTKDQRERRMHELRRERDGIRKEFIEVRADVEKLELERKSLIEDVDRIKTRYASQRDEKSGTLSRHEREIKNYEEKLERLTPEEERAKNKISEMEKELDPKTRETIKKYDECITGIEIVENSIEIAKNEIEDKSDSEKLVERLQSRAEFLKQAKTHLNEKKTERKEIVRKVFNEKISEVYRLLGFKNFERIWIDEMDQIKIRRVQHGRMITQEINRLSTSERFTIGIIVMLAGKEKYLPDFPFFVLDEIITSYDPARFDKVISYIKKTVPYVVVTTLAPSGDIQVVHSR